VTEIYFYCALHNTTKTQPRIDVELKNLPQNSDDVMSAWRNLPKALNGNSKNRFFQCFPFHQTDPRKFVGEFLLGVRENGEQKEKSEKQFTQFSLSASVLRERVRENVWGDEGELL
jgi:hypothetical protein